MPAKLSHPHLETSLSEVEEQMHSGLLCCTWRCKKALAKKRGDKKGKNLALVQRGSEDHLPPELTYEAVFHKVYLNSSFFGSLVPRWALATFLTSMVLSYQPLQATGLLCVQTLNQGVFILSDKASCLISKHAWTQEFKVSQVWDIPCNLLPFPVICCCFWLVPPLYRGGSSPLWSPSLEPIPAEQSFGSFSQCKKLNHPMGSEKPPC